MNSSVFTKSPQAHLNELNILPRLGNVSTNYIVLYLKICVLFGGGEKPCPCGGKGLTELGVAFLTLSCKLGFVF